MNQLHWTFVLGSLRTGGAERATLNLANALIRRGHRVSLVLLHEDGTLREQLNPAVAVHVLPVDRARRAVPSLTILLERLQPDLLVAVQNHMQWAVLRANNRLKQSVPLILNEQSSLDENLRRQGWKGWLLKRWLKGSWKRIAAWTAVSEASAESLRKAFPAAGLLIRAIPNPAVTDELASLSNEAVDHPYFRSGTRVIVAVGRLVESKNFPLLLKAIARLRDEVKLRCIILGDGPERNRLKGLVTQLGLDDIVDLPGAVSNPYAWIRKSHLFVLCSDYEGMPLALIEAMALGCPVVSTDCPGGSGEILRQGDRIYGELVPVGDDAALAQAIKKTLRSPIPSNVLQDAVKDFHANRVAIRYEDLAAELLPERSQHLVMLVGPIAPPRGGVSTHLERLAAHSGVGPIHFIIADFRKRVLIGQERRATGFVALLHYFRKAEIVHLHLAHPVKLLIACWARMSGKKLVYTHHNSRELQRFDTRWTMRLAHQVVLVTPGALEDVRIPEERVQVIPAYLPSRPRSGVGAGVAARLQGYRHVMLSSAFHLPGRPSMLYGRDIYGFDLLLQAALNFPDAVREGTCIVLLDPAGTMRATYEPLLQQLRTAGIDCWYPEEEIHLPSILPWVTVYVRPTRSDGDALAVREALAAGVPVIASDVAPRPTGVTIFPSGKVDALATALEAVLNNSERKVFVQPDHLAPLISLYRRLSVR